MTAPRTILVVDDEESMRDMSADQWLYVVSGRGRATVEGRAVTIQRGSLLLIAAGERHEIRNDGAHPLVTINVYAPPAY
jgi:mannose-6-phosphate isomerase-like protein (cupin superfamily)